jgi:hypothetical protein
VGSIEIAVPRSIHHNLPFFSKLQSDKHLFTYTSASRPRVGGASYGSKNYRAAVDAFQIDCGNKARMRRARNSRAEALESASTRLVLITPLRSRLRTNSRLNGQKSNETRHLESPFFFVKHHLKPRGSKLTFSIQKLGRDGRFAMSSVNNTID